MDSKKNNYGKLFLELCKNQNLFIFNGRIDNDKNIGRCTSTEKSVVDYCTGTKYMIKLVNNFCVM